MYDPIIALNVHVAMLTALESAKEKMEETKGVTQAIVKVVGSLIVSEVERSKRNMKANGMWVSEVPVRDRRYLYSLHGRRAEREVSQTDLDLHLGIVARTLEHKIDKAK
ncbi:hypothetical protein GXP70_12490 [Paenibacillus lycopersici]|uniref:Uncharacterized protein n=1 Tax=Paenibacillus lycopersici TaxID=2704462 RepID=A0A6C0FU48_9BACL|nr:hypothetical protein [Paenibacillus lycopersici]QHT60678.1 hypothetical protein GXP70_12490 [Paenibacillus lycopersici]